MTAIVITIFLAVGLGVLGLSRLFLSRRLRIVERLQRYADLVPEEESLEGPGVPPKEGGAWLRRLGQRFWLGRGYLHYVGRELAKTTILLRPEEFALGAVGTALGLGLLIYLMTMRLPLALVAGGLGFYAWHVMLDRSKGKRVQLFNSQIVQALGLISNGLKVGYSFLQAVEMVAAEMEPPMAVEFRRLLRETNLGVNIEVALRDMARRVESEDMDLVVTAILIQRQVGGNLAEVLDKISHTIRERGQLQNELRSLTAQGRLSGLIVGLLPVGVGFLLYTVSPGFIGVLFAEELGRLLLLLAVAMQILGIFLIRRVLTIKI